MMLKGKKINTVDQLKKFQELCKNDLEFQKAIDGGLDPNSLINGKCLLSWMRNKKQAVILLDSGANAHFINESGESVIDTHIEQFNLTAMIVRLMGGEDFTLEIIKTLVEYGATSHQHKGLSTLDRAVRILQLQPEIVDYLLSQNFKPTCCSLQFLIEMKKSELTLKILLHLSLEDIELVTSEFLLRGHNVEFIHENITPVVQQRVLDKNIDYTSKARIIKI